MDRQIVYPGSIPLDTDQLNPQRNIMIALGYLWEAAFGPTAAGSACFYGLQCLPTTPTADLNVHVQRGCMAQLSTVDNTSYGSLPADTTDVLTKIGINTAVTNFAITPPGTAGYSQNYLIEGQLQESDTTSVVLPYYNASNPSVPYSGPANSGTAQNTQRIQRVALQLKAGTAGPTGSSTALSVPGADSGWTPLWVVNVSNGQTQITSANISLAPNAPVIPTQLTQTRYKLTSNLTLYVNTSGSDSNNGLTTTAPFATIQAAVNSVLSNYDFAGYGVTINVGAGTFTAATVNALPVGWGANSFLNIAGAGGSSTVLNSTGTTACLSTGNGANISISNMTLQGGIGLTAGGASSMNISSGVTFGACTTRHILANGGDIVISANYTIAGGASYHYQTINGGLITSSSTGLTFTVSGGPTFTAFAYAYTGQIDLPSLTYSGSATGTRYIALAGGTILTAGGGASYFPGSLAGTPVPGTLATGSAPGFYA